MMHMAHFSPEDKFNYGLGWTVTRQEDGTIKYGHSGGYVGVLDLVTIRPSEDLAVIIFSNELDSELMSTFLERRAFTAINKAIFWKADYILSQS